MTPVFCVYLSRHSGCPSRGKLALHRLRRYGSSQATVLPEMPGNLDEASYTVSAPHPHTPDASVGYLQHAIGPIPRRIAQPSEQRDICDGAGRDLRRVVMAPVRIVEEEFQRRSVLSSAHSSHRQCPSSTYTARIPRNMSSVRRLSRVAVIRGPQVRSQCHRAQEESAHCVTAARDETQAPEPVRAGIACTTIVRR